MRDLRILIVAACIATGACTSDPPRTPDPAQVARYQKDIEDQLGTTRARQRQEACTKGSPPSIGMTEAKVLSSCWGNPDHFSESVTAEGKQAVWSYPEGYVYFSTGVVTRIVTSR